MDIFNNVLPKGHKLYKEVTVKDNVTKTIMFINNDDCNYFNNDSICFIYTLSFKKENELSILKLEVIPEYRGKGIATFLLIVVAKLHDGMKMILDDMSDNSRKINNIYLRLGLNYTNKYPEPEMEGNCKDISEEWKYFLDRYLGNFFV